MTSEEQNEHEDRRGLKALGSGSTTYVSEYDPNLLETFDNIFPSNPEYLVELECPEFTSRCPLTHQPDFCSLLVTYCPDKKCVESKSLKLYLGSFRERGSFHEECVNTIAKDLQDRLQAHWITVRGDFYPRGGISINPIVTLRK